MDSFTGCDFEQQYANILETFKELGYPQNLIGQWALPLRDAQTLAGILQNCQPKNILEVGTFVGVTTLLMALLSSEETHIHTIDPNFPLKLEMASMKSELYDFDTSILAQELGLRAARKLGVDQKITFHEGGFPTGNTFSSYNTSPSSRIEIVGLDICNTYGPFDFIFVDGLHYEEDVFSDLNLAAEYLKPPGAIAIHDVLGRWGSNVRRGVFRFLEKHEDFHFSHDRFATLFNSIGLLRRHPLNSGRDDRPIPQDIKNGSLFQEKLLPNLAAALVDIFSPASVVQVGGDPALVQLIEALGAATTCVQVPAPPEAENSSAPAEVIGPDNKKQSLKRYDLCLCPGVLDTLSPDSIDKVIQTCVDLSDTVIFAASPPGELGTCQQNNKPLVSWISKFFEKGYLFEDVIRPVLEPHLEELFAEIQQNSSYLLNLYVVKKIKSLASKKIDKDVVKDVILNKERRIEDLQLQILYQRCINASKKTEYAILNQDLNEKNRLLHEEYAALNQKYLEEIEINQELTRYIEEMDLFTKKVIQNTVKRSLDYLRSKVF